MVLTIFERYRLTLLSREHADRYKRLMMLFAKLNGEVIWMQKNTSLIEETMNTSYQLSHKLHEKDADPALSSAALKVASDIHEIKKEYLLIMRGLSEALQTEFKDDGMYIHSILNLLKDTVETETVSDISIECRKDLYTDRHYALMSVFHNLLTNALEAISDGHASLHISQSETSGDYLFQVTDNGPGIKDEYQPQIFDVGFSTKINYETGAVSRGLGLNIVKDIVEQQFAGKIVLQSQPGNTTFYIYIPKTQLEVRVL